MKFYGLALLALAFTSFECNQDYRYKSIIDPLTTHFEDLRSFAATNFKNKWAKGNSWQTFSNFDFDKLAPGDVAIQSPPSAKVLYNKDGEILQVVTTYVYSDTEFSFRFVRFKEHKDPILYVSKGNATHCCP